jgi:Fe-S cluster biogenesis protein NfuA
MAQDGGRPFQGRQRHEFDQRARAIEELVRTLESAGDAGLRATARELVQALMELHRAGLERALELVDQSGDQGAALIDRLGEDDIVKHLLVLHGLHPLDLQTRVHQAIENAQPSLQSHGGVVEHLAVGETGTVMVTLRVEGGSTHGCGSPVATIKTIVEEAIYETAPDVTSLVVDVKAESTATAAFVPIGSLRRRNPDGSVVSPGSERIVAYP